MLTIEQARATLADKGKDLTDEEVGRIRDGMHQLVSLIFDKWLYERNQKKEALKTQNQTAPSPEIPSAPSP